MAAGSLRDATLIEDYLVLIPDAADADAAERAARAVAMPAGIEATIKVTPLAEVAGAVKYLAKPGGMLQVDLPEVQRTQRVLQILVIGPAGDVDGVLHKAAICARVAAAAGHGSIVDFHGSRLFTPAEFDETLPDGFALSTQALVVVQLKVMPDGVWIRTSGLVRFGVPELQMRGIPRELADGYSQIVLAAALTLIDRGALDQPGVLDVDLRSLKAGPWEDIAAWVLASGATGKITLSATWVRPAERPRLIALDLPGGITADKARAAALAFAPAKPPDGVFDALTPEIEATAARAHQELIALAERFSGGIPANELVAIKLLVPIDDKDDISEWLWVQVTRMDMHSIHLVLPEAVGHFKAGQAFEVPLSRALDYLHIRADGTREGAETDRYPQSKPRSKLRGRH